MRISCATYTNTNKKASNVKTRRNNEWHGRRDTSGSTDGMCPPCDHANEVRRPLLRRVPAATSNYKETASCHTGNVVSFQQQGWITVAELWGLSNTGQTVAGDEPDPLQLAQTDLLGDERDKELSVVLTDSAISQRALYGRPGPRK